MITPIPRKRRSAKPQPGEYVKTSISMRADLQLRVDVAARLRGLSRDEFVGEALTLAVKGVHVIDRSPATKQRRATDQASITDRLDEVDSTSSDDEK